jgi:hypothetical protein
VLLASGTERAFYRGFLKSQYEKAIQTRERTRISVRRDAHAIKRPVNESHRHREKRGG